MAMSPFNHKSPTHARSISLPSRTHPLTIRVEEQLYRLRSSDTTSSSSSSLMCENLDGLTDLYDCVDDLLQSPITQRALTQGKADKCVSDVLDGSLALVDTCSTTRDVLFQMKECLQDLQSSLRRRRDFGFANEVGAYMNSRKQASKVIHKCLGDLKRMESKRTFPSLLLEKDYNLVAIIGVLRDVEMITSSLFETLLAFISRSRSKSTGWSLVSKLMHTRCHEGADMCEIEKLDVVLNTLTSQNTWKGTDVGNVHNAQRQLETVELCIQDLEGKLEHLFKSLIKIRVSLLNIISS